MPIKGILLDLALICIDRHWKELIGIGHWSRESWIKQDPSVHVTREMGIKELR